MSETRCRRRDVVVGRGSSDEKATRGGNERVKRRRETNRALEVESRRLREEGAHRYLRQEALTRRDRSREREILIEQLNKGQPSD
jgi:hypothetical protein